MYPATMTVSKVAYAKSMLEIANKDLMLVGSVEDWATSKKIAGLPQTLKVVAEMMQPSLTPILLSAL